MQLLVEQILKLYKSILKDKGLYEQLLNNGIHDSDAEIIVDSYGICETYKKKYNFITNDTELLKHSKDIKMIFHNCFEIFNPHYENPYSI